MLLKAASNPRDENMSGWLHNLPVGGMALIVFCVTYLVAAVIYVAVMALAVGERARSFKAISPGMLPPLGISSDFSSLSPLHRYGTTTNGRMRPSIARRVR